MQNLSDKYLMLVLKLPNNDLYFYLFHYPNLPAKYVTTLDALIFFFLCGY